MAEPRMHSRPRRAGRPAYARVRGFHRCPSGHVIDRIASPVLDKVAVASCPHCVDVPGGPILDFGRFGRTSPARQTSQPIAHLDHIRTTSIPSNHGTFTNHPHISRRFDSAARTGARPKAVAPNQGGSPRPQADRSPHRSKRLSRGRELGRRRLNGGISEHRGDILGHEGSRSRVKLGLDFGYAQPVV
jgi:hypothetical protein